jgi:hypothetical protein
MYPRYFDVPRVSSYHQGADDGAAIRKNLRRSGERLPLHKLLPVTRISGGGHRRWVNGHEKPGNKRGASPASSERLQLD